MYDLLIINAHLVDGTGQPGYITDIAIQGDRIGAIGKIPRKARRVIDASDLTAIPGIIDPHSHADLILPLPSEKQFRLLRGKLTQGITTTIVGNCGLGCAPIGNAAAEAILRDVNAWMTPTAYPWYWRGTGEYLSFLEGNGLALNVATLAPHGPIRLSAMGLSQGRPSKSQLHQMLTLTDQAMKDGALGLSSGLIYPPGMYSAPDELSSLAKIVARYNGIYTSHIRGSSETLIDAVKELIHIGSDSGVRIHHSHIEAVGKEHWQKIGRVIRMEGAAAARGIRISCDMFPYTAAATMMIAIYPPWALEGGIDELIVRLKSPSIRARIKRDIGHRKPVWPPWKQGGWPHNLVMAVDWSGIRIGYVASRKNKQYENLNLVELAERVGTSPFDAISDLLIEERGRISMLVFDVNGGNGSNDLLSELVRHPSCAFCTDAEDYGRGLPHPAAYGAFPRILGRFLNDESGLTFEEAVRKMTSLPASIFGIPDRGAVRPGAFADLVLMDSSTVIDRATFDRPRRSSRGIDTVLLNGTPVVEEGRMLMKQAGVVIRRNV